jgi:GDP-D-mannose 3',5'-epimerase
MGNKPALYLYIEECIDGIRHYMKSDYTGPINIGSDEMISINGLVELVSKGANKTVRVKQIPGPLGVRGRNSDNCLVKEQLGWAPTNSLNSGLEITYPWVLQQVLAEKKLNFRVVSRNWYPYHSATFDSAV